MTPTGQEFLLAEADDFEREAELLRNSVDFQRFLDERSRSPRRISLEELEAETDDEIARLVRVVAGPQIVRRGERLVARPQAAEGARTEIDPARLIEEERDRWPG